MDYLPVLSKLDFVKRYAKGEFGNAAPTWNTLDEFLASGYKGLVHLRNRVKGGPTWYNVPSDSVELCYSEAVGAGIDRSMIYFSAMAPTEKTVLQGEVMQTDINWNRCGLELYYTTVCKPMREALQEEAHRVSGIMASELLRLYLCPNSYEWLQVLLSRYPCHVIEFSTYSVKWGTLPNFNTVFWEVRSY